MTDDIVEHNRKGWDLQVAQGNRWTLPVDAETVARARQGDWSVVLTPHLPVPPSWFPSYPYLHGVRVLALASGGGQQVPLLAAAGADVTVLDNSPAQLARDLEVAQREGLTIRAEQGNMADLSRFADGSFDMVFNPCSVVFVPDVLPVWKECFRVLRPGGELLAGSSNPVNYIFDYARLQQGEFVVRHKIPYADTDLLPQERAEFAKPEEPLEYGHTLEDLIGGQLCVGFSMVGFFEVTWEEPLSGYLPTFFATRARKPIDT